MEVKIWKILPSKQMKACNLPSGYWLEKLIELWLENLHVGDPLLRFKTINVVVENHM
jgi:hypothetical protein